MNTSEMIDPARIIMTGAILAGLSGVPGLFPRLGAAVAQKLTTLLACFASLCGLGGAVFIAVNGMTEHFVIDWSLPFGPCEIWIDLWPLFSLSPFFLFPAPVPFMPTATGPRSSMPAPPGSSAFFSGSSHHQWCCSSPPATASSSSSPGK